MHTFRKNSYYLLSRIILLTCRKPAVLSSNQSSSVSDIINLSLSQVSIAIKVSRLAPFNPKFNSSLAASIVSGTRNTHSFNTQDLLLILLKCSEIALKDNSDFLHCV